jgi:hypothetical protein
MANAFTQIQDKIIAREGIAQLNKILAPLYAFSTNISAEAAKKGDTINVPNWKTRTAVDFAGDYETTDSTDAGVPVSLTKHLYASAHISDREFMESSADMFMGIGGQLGKAVAAGVFGYVCGLVTAASFGNAAGDKTVAATATDFTKDDVLDARGKLTAKGARPDESAGVLDSAYFTNLLNDAVFFAQNFGGTEAVRGGQIPGLYGFSAVYETTGIGTVDAGALKGFFAHRSSLAVAVRTLLPQSNRVMEASDVVTDDETDIGMTYRRWYSSKSGKMWFSFEALCGAAKVNAALVRVATA